MNTTTNLGLKMPEYSDQADIQDINDNMDILDGKLGAVGNTSVQGQIDAVNNKIGSTALPTTAQTLTGAIAEHETDLGTKADKVTGATTGHFAGLDANGNLVDSGKQASDFATPADVEKKADAIEESNSTEADVMSFSDGANNLPMEVAVAINPVQDTHGLDPYPAGAVNQFTLTLTTQEKNGITFTVDQSAGTITANGTASAQVSIAMGTYPSDTAKKYYVKGIPSGASSTTYFITLHSSKQNTYSDGLYDGYTDGTATPNIYIRSGVTVNNLVFKPFFCEEDAYSNICPIGGFTGVDISRIGVNLHNKTTDTTGWYISASGVPTESASYSYSALIPVEEGKKYTFSGVNSRDASESKRLHGYDANGTWVKQIVYTNASANSAFSMTATIDSGIKFVRISYRTTDTEINVVRSNIYSITFPSEAGTVYGGTLTVNRDGSGKLIVDRATVTINGTETFIDVTSANVFYVTKSEIGLLDVSTENDYCNMFKPVTASGSSSMSDGEIARQSTANNRIYIKSNIFAGYTASQLATYFSNNNLEYCGKLASPVNVSFTAQQIRSLLGENNLWADSGNVLSVVYYADTKMYIDNLFNSILPATGVSF